MRFLVLLLALAVLAEPAAAQPFIRVRDFVAGELAAGDSVQPDGSRYDTYRFRAQPGRVYYLYLFAEFEGWLDVGSRLGPGCGGACSRAEDDGRAGSTVAMQFIPERPGTYLIRAGGMRGEEGRYELTLESQEVPEEVADSLWTGADTLGLPVDSLPDPEIYGGTDTLPVLSSGAPRKGLLGMARLDGRRCQEAPRVMIARAQLPVLTGKTRIMRRGVGRKREGMSGHDDAFRPSSHRSYA